MSVHYKYSCWVTDNSHYFIIANPEKLNKTLQFDSRTSSPQTCKIQRNYLERNKLR